MNISSNWVAYGIGDGANENASLTGYGFIPQFHLYSAQVDQWFAQAKANGQTWVTLPIWFYHGSTDGFAVDSQTAQLTGQALENFTAILKLAASTGFTGVYIRFMPEAQNCCFGWTSWNEAMFQENWNFVFNTMNLVNGLKLPLQFYWDLGNEHLHEAMGSNQNWVDYCWKLWWNVNYVFPGLMVTFSAIPGLGTVAQFPSVFRVYAPKVIDFHIYGAVPERGLGSSYSVASTLYGQLQSTPYKSLPWIWGEDYMNDPANSSEIVRFVADTGQKILLWSGWPNDRIKGGDFDGTEPVDESAEVKNLGGL